MAQTLGLRRDRQSAGPNSRKSRISPPLPDKSRHHFVGWQSFTSLQRPHSATQSPLGFGLGRLGLLPLHAPWLTSLLILAALALAILGASKIKTDAALQDLFRSNSKVFHDFQQLNKSFPVSTLDLYTVIEADDLMTPKRLEAIRNFHLELGLVPAVRSAMSMFSIWKKPEPSGKSKPVFPDQLPTGAAFASLKQEILTNPLIRGRFLSDKRPGQPQIAVVIVSLKETAVATQGLRAAIDEVRQTAAEFLTPVGLKAHFTGTPMMRLEVVESTKRDRILFNLIGFLVGSLACILFFRNWRHVTIVSVAPLASLIGVFGVLGHLGVALNPLTNTILPLVLVITFSDSLHMLFAINRARALGASLRAAVREAVITVGPACALTSLTTALALGALLATDSYLIRTYAYAAALSVLVAFLAVILVLPAVALVVLAHDDRMKLTQRGLRARGGILNLISGLLARHLPALSMPVALFGILITGLAGAAYHALDPYYRISDMVPENRESAAVAQTLEQNLGGIFPVQIMLQWPSHLSLYSKPVLHAIAEAHTILETQDEIDNVWSLETIRRWAGESLGQDVKKLQTYVEKLPPHLQAQLKNAKGNAAAIIGFMRDMPAGQVNQLVEELNRKLDHLKRFHPELKVTVTGLPTVAAQRATASIEQLNISLFLAVCMVIVLTGLAFRSTLIAVLSIVPNMFALLATGGLLYLFSGQLEYASVVALTVAFGIAIDDTIHFFNRLRLEAQVTPTLTHAVQNTICHIGPVLILTTVILTLGLSMTMFSIVPMTGLFGKTAAIIMIMALLGDLLLLPAMLFALARLGLLKNRHVRKARPKSTKGVSFGGIEPGSLPALRHAFARQPHPTGAKRLGPGRRG